ncbi:MAG: hypothetical protein M3R50_03315 [Bacteroidota bacterium]|nr:hypothetical protein [Bacteroidota bacterium]
MKKKGLIITIFVIIVFILVAIITKPSDKQIKIKAVEAVWGTLVPDVNKYPGYYEEFMNYTTVNVYIDDWVVVKRIRFNMGKEIRPIGFAAFDQVLIRHK